ncbi:B-cell receptor-associated protein 31-like [Chenopodium quinoa]|uniref:Endoplasmic reticulum transmembrane protein n=1 Tax=Chenopodium quinoa TaxID=63459 RepID=A0A803MY67_CHEQI|nr:B-cell receptor-associated protein 31-like [Chenopodium quinoa]
MLHLLFSIIFVEMAVILLLLFRTPLRKLVIMGLDRMKRGRGPVVITTVGGTILVLLVTSISSILTFQQREIEPGTINPTDQVLFTRSLLDTSLMGFILFLGLMMDRLHHYIRELRLLRKTMEAVKKQSRSFDDAKNGSSEDLKAMEEEVASLKSRIKTLESECAAKTDEVKSAESKSEALKKQSEGLLLEYDRLLEDNQSLRSQLQEIGQGLANSDGKKTM